MDTPQPISSRHSKIPWIFLIIGIVFVGTVSVLGARALQPLISAFLETHPVVETFQRAQATYAMETEDDPSLGAKNSRLVIVIFTDLLCEECRAQAQLVRQALAVYTSQLQLIIRDFPQPDDSLATLASQGAYCAHQQGKFWIYYDRISIKPRPTDVAALTQLASDTGVEVESFQDCLESEAAKQEVASDSESAQAEGVTSRPTYFFNGQKIPGPISEARLYEILDTIFPESVELREPDKQFETVAI